MPNARRRRPPPRDMDAIQRHRDNIAALHRAVESGNLDDARYYVQFQRVNVEGRLFDTTSEDDGETVLLRACRLGNLDMVQFLMEEGGAKIDAADGCRMTALHHAVVNGHLDIVHYLLQQKGCADVMTMKDLDGDTVLHKSTRNVEIARLLLQYAATEFGKNGCLQLVLTQNEIGFTALHMAKSVEMARLLYNVGGSQLVHMVDDDGQTALYHHARHDSSLAVVQYLLESCGANARQRDTENGFNALYAAVDNNALANARYILQRCGGSTDLLLAQDLHEGETVFHVAVERNNLQLVKDLVRVGGIDLILRGNIGGRTVLHQIASRGHGGKSLIKYLVRKGGDALKMAIDNDGLPALHTCVEWHNVRMAQFMVNDCDMDVELVNRQGRTALHHAVYKSSHRFAAKCIEMVQCLVQQCGANVNATDNDGRTALHLAVARASSKELAMPLVQCLALKCGANINAVDHTGRSPLHLAIARADVNPTLGLELVNFLVEMCGANVDATDRAGRTSLHVAIACANRKDSEELVDCLVVSGGADINIADENGRTPLHDACSIDDSYNVVSFLLHSRSANLDASDDNGCTALHCACALGSIRMVRLLIHTQANVHAVDNAGRTALSHACSSSVDCLAKVRLLVKAGVNVDAADVNHRTALHYACTTGQNVHVLRLLLAFHAINDV